MALAAAACAALAAGCQASSDGDPAASVAPSGPGSPAASSTPADPDRFPGPSGSPGSGGSTGSGARGARGFDKHHTRVTVAPGERFTLELAENPSTGYAWVVEAPRPDGTVVEPRGKRYDGDSDLVGGGGIRYLDYRARSAGHTRIALRSCFRCGTPQETADADHKATKVTFDVTVEK